MEDAAYWLASHGLLSLLPYISQAHQPRTGIVDSGLGPPLSVSIKKMPPQKCPQANMMEVISQLRFPLPGMFQVDNYD